MVAKSTGGLSPELRRGLLVMAILGALRQEHYGYVLREALAASGIDVTEGTLYPLLRRLESQALLESRWQLGQGRPRRYYKTSAAGKKALAEMIREWTTLSEGLDRILAQE